MANDSRIENVLLDTDNLSTCWNDAFGITSQRRLALIRHPSSINRDADTFFGRRSETALTLFALGRSDRWVQADASRHWRECPRFNDGWNRRFFQSIWLKPLHVTDSQTPLRNLLGKRLGLTDDALKSAVIMIEVFASENRGLTDNGGKLRVQDISFNKTCLMGTKFDAVILLTDAKPCKRIICVEAKLTADQGENQIRRGLEAAFFLTRTQRSVFHKWDYSYIFLHPPGKVYGGDYDFVSNPLQAVANYGNDLNCGKELPNSKFKDLWADFEATAPSRCHDVTWSEVLTAMECDGWKEDEYHKRILDSRISNAIQLVEASKSRLHIARGRGEIDELLRG